MTCTVFATLMGLFSKNSNGQGIGPIDVCLTPPTPPAGPVPVPYVNITFAKDLSDGSVTVKADQGIISVGKGKGKTKKSSGDEPGNIMTKGAASFTNQGEGKFEIDSFVVMVEGNGVNCMGHMMGQNQQGALLNCIDPAAIVIFAVALAQHGLLKPCAKPYDSSCRPDGDPSAEQRAAVDGKPCWECQRDSGSSAPIKPLWNTTKDASGKIIENPNRGKQSRQKEGGPEAMTHDHQPPMKIAWEMGGCHMGKEKFKEFFDKKETVRPHCQAHYMSQGREAKKFGNNLSHG